MTKEESYMKGLAIILCCDYLRLFCLYVGFFCMLIDLFCVYVGLFYDKGRVLHERLGHRCLFVVFFVSFAST